MTDHWSRGFSRSVGVELAAIILIGSAARAVRAEEKNQGCTYARQVLTAEKLKPILAAHAAWLKKESGKTLAVLCKANLRSANLQGAFFYQADLRSADLQKANLLDANLTQANIGAAKLQGANLQGAQLLVVDLRAFDLSSLNLQKADLNGGKADIAARMSASWGRAHVDMAERNKGV